MQIGLSRRAVLGSSGILGSIQVGNSDTIGWADVILARDAAAVLALKNGATAQEFRVYGTTTGPKYAYMVHNGTDATFGSIGGGTTKFSVGGSVAWVIDASEHFIADTDNAADIGASGANRPRTGYFGTALVVGTNPASTGTIRLHNASTVYFRNAANSADIRVLDLAASNIITIGASGDSGVTIGGGAGALSLFGAAPVARTSLAAPTGTTTRTTFDTATVTTAQLAERVMAIIVDLRATGYWS